MNFAHKFPNLKICEHPLLLEKLTVLRNRETPHYQFRQQLEEVSLLLFYEASQHLKTIEEKVQTPLEPTRGKLLRHKIALVPILRAGLGMVTGILKIAPAAHVGMVGMYRDENTLKPVDYYLRLPGKISSMEVFLLDPMLATGGSATSALKKIKERKPASLTMISIISAPEGVQLLSEAHPNVPIFTAALDRQLNERGYILPGLGDAGDRYFGTE